MKKKRLSEKSERYNITYWLKLGIPAYPEFNEDSQAKVYQKRGNLFLFELFRQIAAGMEKKTQIIEDKYWGGKYLLKFWVKKKKNGDREIGIKDVFELD